MYEKIGESTEVALRILAEKVNTDALFWSKPSIQSPTLDLFLLIHHHNIRMVHACYIFVTGWSSWFWFYAICTEYAEQTWKSILL